MRPMDPRGFVILAISLVAVVRPDIVRGVWNSASDRRLAQLDAGAEETHFEERRQLEAYKIRRSWAVRLFGAIFLSLGIFLLFR